MDDIRKYIKTILLESQQTHVGYKPSQFDNFDDFIKYEEGRGANCMVGGYGEGFYFFHYRTSVSQGVQRLLQKERSDNPFIYRVKLTMNNPFNLGILESFDKAFVKYAAQYKGISNMLDKGMYLASIRSALKDIGVTPEEFKLAKAIRDDSYKNIGKNVESLLKSKGYDSLITGPIYKEYVVYDPKQITLLDIKPYFKD